MVGPYVPVRTGTAYVDVVKEIGFGQLSITPKMFSE
jgi:hypothetical protein